MSGTEKEESHHSDWRETPGHPTDDAVDPNTRNRAQDEANAHQGNLDITPPKGERAPGLAK